jgi:hypothetical protein
MFQATSGFISWAGIFTNLAGVAADLTDPQAPPNGQRYHRAGVSPPALPTVPVLNGTISLYSTGGLLASATNQPTATFTSSGPTLGAGLHSFSALVQPPSGTPYRTLVQWVRLVNP